VRRDLGRHTTTVSDASIPPLAAEKPNAINVSYKIYPTPPRRPYSAHMRYVAKTCPETTAECDAYLVQLRTWIASIFVWVCEVIEWAAPLIPDHPWVRDLLPGYKARVARDLRRSARLFRQAVIIHARTRLSGPLSTLWQRGFPGAPARGLRRGERIGYYRRLLRIFPDMNSGTLRQRAEKLMAAMKNFETLVARAVKRMRSYFLQGRPRALILTDPRNVCAPEALALIAAAQFDTS
jgi:hypothetical protein